MKLFKCVIDDGRDVFKTLVPAKSRKELISVYGGNGSFVKIKDVTEEYFNETSSEKLKGDLVRTDWGEGEIKFQSFLVCPLLSSLQENMFVEIQKLKELLSLSDERMMQIFLQKKFPKRHKKG